MKMLRGKRSQLGAAIVEYGLLVALIAVVAIVGIRAVGTGANDQFNNVATELSPAAADDDG
jgi:pilus assembly protein Flp/PilA